MNSKKQYKILLLLLLLGLIPALKISTAMQKGKISKIWLIGDSTVTNYALEEDYQAKRFPQTGWGQVFQEFFTRIA